MRLKTPEGFKLKRRRSGRKRTATPKLLAREEEEGEKEQEEEEKEMRAIDKREMNVKEEEGEVEEKGKDNGGESNVIFRLKLGSGTSGYRVIESEDDISNSPPRKVRLKIDETGYRIVPQVKLSSPRADSPIRLKLKDGVGYSVVQPDQDQDPPEGALLTPPPSRMPRSRKAELHTPPAASAAAVSAPMNASGVSSERKALGSKQRQDYADCLGGRRKGKGEKTAKKVAIVRPGLSDEELRSSLEVFVHCSRCLF